MLFGQNKVVLTEQTLKINAKSDYELLYALNSGDQIVINISEQEQKELKEFSIVEYPNNVVFSTQNAVSVTNKIISIKNKSVYVFKFNNTSFQARKVNFKLERIPQNAISAQFNTQIKWESRPINEVYSKENPIVGYDTLWITKTKKSLVNQSYAEELIIDKSERVHSHNHLSEKNKNIITVPIPNNENNANSTKKVKAWSYWIGVGEESEKAWKENILLIKNIANGANYILGGGPLGELAIGGISKLIVPTMGDDVKYYFITDHTNALSFLEDKKFLTFEKGQGIASYRKITDRLQGTYYLGLENNNLVQGINVSVKISVLWEISNFADVEYKEQSIKPIFKNSTNKTNKTVLIPVVDE